MFLVFELNSWTNKESKEELNSTEFRGMFETEAGAIAFCYKIKNDTTDISFESLAHSKYAKGEFSTYFETKEVYALDLIEDKYHEDRSKIIYILKTE